MADSSVSRFGCYTIIWDTTPHRASERVPVHGLALTAAAPRPSTMPPFPLHQAALLARSRYVRSGPWGRPLHGAPTAVSTARRRPLTMVPTSNRGSVPPVTGSDHYRERTAGKGAKGHMRFDNGTPYLWPTVLRPSAEWKHPTQRFAGRQRSSVGRAPVSSKDADDR
jgi:hypothetical protein